MIRLDDLTDDSDEALCAAAVIGDRQAFDLIVTRYGPILYRYARRMLAVEADAADVVQDTFVAAWRQLPTFRGASSLRTWLFAICYRKIVDSYRVKRAQPVEDWVLETTEDTTTGDPFASVSSAEFLAALEAALAELPPRQRGRRARASPPREQGASCTAKEVAVSEQDPLLHRAASFLRSSPEPGWDAISARVLAAVHASARPGWPLRVHASDPARGNVFVSDHALRSLIARELRRRFLCQPTKVEFILDGTVIRAVDITVTGSYGTQLRELGDAVRLAVLALIHDTLGVAAAGPTHPIDVAITDVVTGDPLD